MQSCNSKSIKVLLLPRGGVEGGCMRERGGVERGEAEEDVDVFSSVVESSMGLVYCGGERKRSCYRFLSSE